jgi:hypothetical protein
MKNYDRELLARIEMLEADMAELRQIMLEDSLVFVSDMDAYQGASDLELLQLWDVEDEVEQ